MGRIAMFISLLLVINIWGISAQDKPNIILIVADDLGYGDLGITGSTEIRTPNIDKLANDGVIFTQGYVSSPVCAPSRAGLITGKNQVGYGFDNNISNNQPGFDPEFRGLPVSETTIATRLKSLGYVTGLIGKWHLGDKPQFQPQNRGFDEYWTYEGGGHNYFEFMPDGKGYNAPIQCNYKVVEEITYLTDDKGKECVDFIKRHKTEPFFLFASFNAPHGPMHALSEDKVLYKDIKNKKRQTYAAMVHRLDVNIGKIVNTVEELGLMENTLFVFLSDNGGPVNHNASINAPYRGQKGILLEGGIHVPFFMTWNNRISAGLLYENPVSSLDLAPTFYFLAGGETLEDNIFDGVNLVPYILGRNESKPHESLFWRFTISAALREGDWKLVRLPDRLPMLYHLASDTSEKNNLALDSLEITNRMLKKLGNWDVSLPHPVFLEGKQWKERQLKLYDKTYQLEQGERNK